MANRAFCFNLLGPNQNNFIEVILTRPQYKLFFFVLLARPGHKINITEVNERGDGKYQRVF